MFKSKHEKVKALLPLYGDKDLSPEERKLIEEHLRVCRECQAEWESLRWAISLTREIPRVPAPRSFVVRAADLEKVRAPVGLYVARAFTALAAALFIILIGLDLLAFKAAPIRALATPLPPTPAIVRTYPEPEQKPLALPVSPPEEEVMTREFGGLEEAPTPIPAPVPEAERRLNLRWLPWEIAAGFGAIAAGLASWILGRRR